MARLLKQSTAYIFRIGPFLDDGDGKTAETGLSIAQADIQISKTGGAMIIAITIIGESRKRGIGRRDGAKPGDIVAVTGNIGDSNAGLRLALGEIKYFGKGARRLKNAYGFPPIRLKEGEIIASSGANSLIDISDGLAQDWTHNGRVEGRR